MAMFSSKDIKQIMDRNSSEETVKAQVERFKKGFPWMKIAAPATPGNGIEEIDVKCKFVPASGEASRMFKDLFSGLDTLNSGKDVAADSPAAKFVANICRFAFYDKELFGTPADSAESRKDILCKTLTEAGLNYGAKPKGVLKFHKYPDGEIRTAFAEHLVEAQDYMRNSDGSANLVVTISPEHQHLFEEALAQVKEEYEKRYGVKYNVTFTFQDKSTDTIAVDVENRPFRTETDALLFRPAGHGALIYNLNQLKEEVVSIKNIDNVAVEKYLPVTAKYKKVLLGKAVELRDKIFGYLKELDAATGEGMAHAMPPYIPSLTQSYDERYMSPEVQNLCNDIEEFLLKELCINGQAPQVFQCVQCGSTDRPAVFSAAKGGLVCDECDADVVDGIVLDNSTLYSMQYIESSKIEKLYTFTVTDKVMGQLGKVMKRLMERYVDKSFKSLEILETLL